MIAYRQIKHPAITADFLGLHIDNALQILDAQAYHGLIVGFHGRNIHNKIAFQNKVKTVAPQLSKYKLSFYEVNFLPNLGGYDGIKKKYRR